MALASLNLGANVSNTGGFKPAVADLGLELFRDRDFYRVIRIRPSWQHHIEFRALGGDDRDVLVHTSLCVCVRKNSFGV